MSLLDALLQGGHLRPLDQALAATLRRLDGGTHDLVQAGAALASLAVAQGHAGFDPSRPELLLDAALPWPAPAEWDAALASSTWVARPLDGKESGQAPLAFDNGLLYLRRYREYEQRLATRLRSLAAQAPASAGAEALRTLFDTLFPGAGDDDRQAQAATLALRRALLLVTGGPGTGKTTTITRLLLLLVAQARHAGAPTPRIALAAPTGRAADRMAQSVRTTIERLHEAGVDPTLLEALPHAASTLHRLLGTIPDSPRFRHDAANPLPFDVVVVDEASMVDLPMMCKLVEAVADGARLLLLGDPDQLPSVEAGDVLSGIVAAADGGPLAGHRVHLQRGYRQAEGFELAPLATAVRDGDADAVLASLRDHPGAGVQFHEDMDDPLGAQVREPLLAHWRMLASAPSPAEALALAGQLRLLAALRTGPQGTQALNARIEDALAGGHRDPYFQGRLLLVTENSYRHRLFNGDIGVCLRDDGDAMLAWFPGQGAGEVRAFHPASLPAHESAFAMTVHKAQGSEFDTVWLLLPRHPNRVLSRELLYTALTRARRELHLCATEAILRETLGRQVQRVSGLARRLLDGT
ncbi:MAG TPA: exodeoxyribonuclease V subunit alpha [Xanthomonadaceae bacterium]|nr:exodeoxyribonuclease V subunit alpha [Xanthomonadaceae bacterium]